MKTKRSHTPGPWDFVNGTSDGNIPAFYVRCGNRGIAHLIIEERDTRYETAHTEANARLIAAAPDLLEALKAAADYIAATIGHRGGDIMEAADAAIARAESKP